MKYFDKSELRASFICNGEKQYITPGTHRFGGLEITLDHNKVSADADYLRISLRNTGTENTGRIQSVKTLDLDVKTCEKLLYHSLEGDDCGEISFMPRDFEIDGAYHEEPFGGRSSCRDGFPFFDLTWGGESAVIGIGWTGQWAKDITRTSDGFGVQIGLAHSDFYLKPGECVIGASVLIVKGGDAVDTRRRFRSIIREYYSPKTYIGDEMYLPVSIQCFDRYFQALGETPADERWATEKGQFRTVDCAKKTKYIDTLWIDAAWFKDGFMNGGVGNLGCAEGFPNSLRPVADYAHENGMKFVVWFEPERVCVGTDLWAHTEKLLSCKGQKNQKLFNLADDSARAFLRDYLIGMIRDNAIDVYRQDFNMDPIDFWLENDEEGREGVLEMKYIAGMYDLWDTLLAEFPNLLIDNCSSGGRRLDLETSRRSVTLWKSDTGCFPDSAERRPTTWSQNQTLGVCEYLPYLACAVWDSDAYTVRSTATQGLACNFDIFNPDFDYAAAEKILAEVEEMREYWNGDFYPLTSASTGEDVWAMFQLSLGDRGAVYVFRRDMVEADYASVCVKAVDRDRKYRVTFSDENLSVTEAEMSGAELADGITITINDKRSSVLIKYSAM